MSQERRNRIREIIIKAGELAKQTGCSKVYPEHLLLAMVLVESSHIMRALEQMEVNVDKLVALVKEYIADKLQDNGADGEIPPTISAAAVLRRVHEEAWKMGT